jgi:hypothetical protein
MISAHQNWFLTCRVTWRVESPTACATTLRSTIQAQGRRRSLSRGACLTDKEPSAPVASHHPLALHVPTRSSLIVCFHPICDSPLQHLRHQGFWLITTVNARPCSQVISLTWASGWYEGLPCLARVLSSSRMFLPLHAPPEGYQIILLAHLCYDR